MQWRIGQGYDSHALVEGRPLYIGGVQIESDRGSLGHSDGDALLHALIDAILGALGRGDIGLWFPDNDPAFKGIRSTELLRRVLEDDKLPKFKIGNIDITLFLNQPKMKPHRESIETQLGLLLKMNPADINLKAKTWEGFQVNQVISASVTLILELVN
jgi:2-C-methyl-D-erythritol 2,4-cyclodiphosphate synthase